MRAVLQAAALELARSGYVAFRIEDVATRARVNRTTIYRRWPTKADLVSAILRSFGGPRPQSLPGPLREQSGPGGLREQLLQLADDFVERARSAEGKGVARIAESELDHPEVAALAREVRAQFRAPWMAVVQRAIECGELKASLDVALVVDTMLATIRMRVFRPREKVDRHFLGALIDLVLEGAATTVARRRVRMAKTSSSSRA